MKILLVGIDGLRYDVAKACGKAQNLMKLAETGHFAKMQMEAPTLSGPGWSSILTGTTHAQHGVRDNTFIGSQLAYHPDFLSQAFYADQQTATLAAAGWPPLVDPASSGPVIYQRWEQQRAELHEIVVRDGETYGYRTTDAEIAGVVAASLQHKGPDASFVHFCHADETAHIYGVTSPQYPEAIERTDQHLGTVVKAVNIRAEQTGESWLVMVTTDHGHVDAGGHGGNTAHETTSFVLATTINHQLSNWPKQFKPHEIAPYLLAHRAG